MKNGSEFSKEDKKQAFKRLKNVCVIVPDRAEQRLVAQELFLDKSWGFLKNLLTYLADRNAIGTGAVLVWVVALPHIGDVEKLLQLLEGTWREVHQLAGEPQWAEEMDRAYSQVKKFVEEQEEEKVRAGSGNLEEL